MPRLRVNYKFTVLHTATATADSADSAGSGFGGGVALLADADVKPPLLSGDNCDNTSGVEDERDKV